MAVNDDSIAEYLSGSRLYGDDFTQEQIDEWFEDEREGYASLGVEAADGYEYEFNALNTIHGFRHLPATSYRHVLCLGGATGEELVPILGRVQSVTILEPSQVFRKPSLSGVPCSYVEPSPSGIMPFEDRTFDLVTCFGTLHHIPNVSTVLREAYRCVEGGGHMLLREPTVSMGDWRFPRGGLTGHERGIPLPILREIVQSAGFTVARESLCMFPVTPRISRVIRHSAYDLAGLVTLDNWLARLFRWNYRYHATRIWQKLRPAAVFMVLRKPNDE